MSIWQFFARLDDETDGNGLTEAEADDLWEWIKAEDGD